jgi:hypothetical protein
MEFVIREFQVTMCVFIGNVYKVLGEALKKNTTLRVVKLDKNKVTITGYSSLRYALRYNTTLQTIPFPHQDFALVRTVYTYFIYS